MITINDNDLPITVAEKIINGTKPSNASLLAKSMAEALTGEKCETMDMFSLGELKEIADYLTIFCIHNENKD